MNNKFAIMETGKNTLSNLEKSIHNHKCFHKNDNNYIYFDLFKKKGLPSCITNHRDISDPRQLHWLPCLDTTL